MRKLLAKLKSRKGISLTEVVISMAVVVIVTGTAITLLMASTRFDNTYNTRTHQLNACESAVHCIRFTDDADKLDGYLKRLGFTSEDKVIYTFQNNDTVKVTCIEGVWTVTFDNETLYKYEKP